MCVCVCVRARARSRVYGDARAKTLCVFSTPPLINMFLMCVYGDARAHTLCVCTRER
jgi:hypothetical protein